MEAGLGDARDVDVVVGQLVLHDLLERGEREALGLRERQGLAVGLLQVRLRALAARAHGLGLVLGERARRIRVVELRPVDGVVARHEQRHAERSRHFGPLALAVLAEREREVADRLRQRARLHRLVVREAVVLRLDARVVHERPRVGDQTAHGGADVRVDLHDLLDRVRVQQRRREPLLDGEDHALRGPNPDRRRPELDGLDRVLHLEEAALGAEGVHAPVVLALCHEHGGGAEVVCARPTISALISTSVALLGALTTTRPAEY